MIDRHTPTEPRFAHRSALRDHADGARIDRLWLRLRASRGRRSAKGSVWPIAAAVVLGFALGTWAWPRSPAMLDAGLPLHSRRSRAQLPAVLAAGTVARVVPLPGGGWLRLEPETIVAAGTTSSGAPDLHLLHGEVTLLGDLGAGGPIAAGSLAAGSAAEGPASGRQTAGKQGVGRRAVGRWAARGPGPESTALRLRIGSATATGLNGMLRAHRREQGATLQLLAGDALLRRADAPATSTGEPLVTGRIVALTELPSAKPPASSELLTAPQSATDTDASSSEATTAAAAEGPQSGWHDDCPKDDYQAAFKRHNAPGAELLTAKDLTCLATGLKETGHAPEAVQINRQILLEHIDSVQAIAAARSLASHYRQSGQPNKARKYYSLYERLHIQHKSRE